MAVVPVDHYASVAERTDILHEFAKEFPKLGSMEYIGHRHEDREIWLLTVTNSETGPASEKPAFWAAASIHAAELAPTDAIILHLRKHRGRGASVWSSRTPVGCRPK
jgi:Zinc carboxypeptidase